MSYRDKIKLLIVFEQRLTLLSKYFSLEVLRRKNKTHSDVKKLLKKISQLDTNQNKRELDMVKQLREPQMVEASGGAPEDAIIQQPFVQAPMEAPVQEPAQEPVQEPVQAVQSKNVQNRS